VVGGAAPVLSGRRLAAFVVLATGLALYFSLHERLPNLSLWWDVAVIGVLVIPAVFATVLLLLPLRRARHLWIAALVLAVLATAFEFLEWQAPASFAKLGAATFAGWILLEVFEEVSWVVAVALVIPWVDAYSVWRGPTNTIVEHHKGVFERLSFAFPAPGQQSTANLGIPDILFFAVFLAAADRFGLRTRLTWFLMAASFGVTIALAVWLDLGGLPALPLLSLAFLGANADLLWRQVRFSSASPPRATDSQS
jgi:hypothetical protein